MAFVDKSALLDALFEEDDPVFVRRIKKLIDVGDYDPNWMDEFKEVFRMGSARNYLGDIGFNALCIVMTHIADYDEGMEAARAEEARYPTPVYVEKEDSCTTVQSPTPTKKKQKVRDTSGILEKVKKPESNELESTASASVGSSRGKGKAEAVAARGCTTRSMARKIKEEIRKLEAPGVDGTLKYFLDVYLPAHREDYPNI